MHILQEGQRIKNTAKKKVCVSAPRRDWCLHLKNDFRDI